MSSGTTAQDHSWKSREQAAEAQYAKAKEQEQIKAIQENLKKEESKRESTGDLGIEGGYGGQEDLEDRYATTSGEH